jgi:DNA-directed RNA polymerase specialized sigma24 family protein
MPGPLEQLMASAFAGGGLAPSPTQVADRQFNQQLTANVMRMLQAVPAGGYGPAEAQRVIAGQRAAAGDQTVAPAPGPLERLGREAARFAPAVRSWIGADAIDAGDALAAVAPAGAPAPRRVPLSPDKLAELWFSMEKDLKGMANNMLRKYRTTKLDPGDLLNNAFMELLQKGEATMVPVGEEVPYLTTAIRNQMEQQLMRQYGIDAAEQVRTITDKSGKTIDVLDTVADSASLADDAPSGQIGVASAAAAPKIDPLDEKILRMYVERGFSRDQIAKALGVSDGGGGRISRVIANANASQVKPLPQLLHDLYPADRLERAIDKVVSTHRNPAVQRSGVVLEKLLVDGQSPRQVIRWLHQRGKINQNDPKALTRFDRTLELALQELQKLLPTR